MIRLIKLIPVLTLILLTTQITYADNLTCAEEEALMIKHSESVEKAKPKDWKTPALCANDVITQRIKSKEALEWVNKSIEIKETIFNRVVKGDYYVVNEEIDKAQKEYIRAINLARETGKNEMIPDIQWKVLVAMGVQNYLDFHANNQ
ncbi:hypothetical protein ACFLU5_05440 [Bacteroidota bacterium]